MYRKTIFQIALIFILVFGIACAEGLTAFTTTDFNGNVCTEAIFEAYDLTIVNVWATWCGWCVKEMPYFSKLKSMLPENMNLITICEDAMTEPEKAYQILEVSDALDVTTLKANDEINDRFLFQIYAYPTTYFLDHNGNVLGDPIIGVPTLGEDVAEAYCERAVELWNIIKNY